MSYIKVIAHVFANPLLLAVLAAIAGCVLRLSGRKRTAAVLFAAAVAITYCASTAVVGDALLGSLEERYPPFRGGQTLAPAPWIVVLGSDYAPRDGIPVTAALDRDGLVRIVEGVRLAREYSGSRLLVSGGQLAGLTPPAHGYAELARDLGIDPAAITVSDKPLDTASEARAVANLLGKTPFLLVTSAYHMPRAMRLMQNAGARPIPAPTGQLVNGSARTTWSGIIPGAAGLGKTERALHEYLGLLAVTLGFN
ncbi:MAG: ElyC/SanA/YdcF family protein [Steroidobacteraceae bacterium]